MTTEDDNVELLQRMEGIVNRREFDRAAELVAPNMIRHDLVGAYPGVTGETVVDFLGTLVRGAPDLRMSIQDIFGAGARVTVRLVLEGTHKGPLFGQEATGKRFSVNAINIYRLENGRIAETWQLQDIAGFMSQISG